MPRKRILIVFLPAEYTISGAKASHAFFKFVCLCRLFYMEEPTFACKIGQLPRVPVDYLRCRQFMDAVLLAGEVPGFAAATEDVELLRTLLSLPDGTLAFRGIEAGFFQLSCGDAVPVVFVCDDAVGYFGIASGDVMFLVHNNDGAKVRYVLDGEKRKYVARDNLVTQASFQLTALQVQGLQLFAHIVANCNGSAGSSRVELWATGQTPAVTVLVQAGKYAAQVLEKAAPALAAAAVQRPRSKKRPRPEVALRGERQEDTFSMPGSLAFGASGSLAFGASGSLAFSVPFTGRSPLLPPSRAISPSLEFDGIDFDGLLTDHALSFSLDAQEPPTAEVLVPEVAAEEPAVSMYVCLYLHLHFIFIFIFISAGFFYFVFAFASTQAARC